MINQYKPKFRYQKCLKHNDQNIEYFYYRAGEEVVQYYCKQCLLEDETLQNKVQSISIVIPQIEDELLMKRSLILKELRKMSKEIEKFQGNIQTIIIEWMQKKVELEELVQSYSFDEQVKLINSQQQYCINSEDSHFLTKIEYERECQVSKIYHLLEQSRISLIKFQQVNFMDYGLLNNNQSQYYKLMGELSQQGYACGIGLSHNNDIMMATNESTINIYQLEKSQTENTYKLNEKTTLNQHTKRILCSVYSKKINWFATSGCDGNVFCFKLINDQWVSSVPGYHHQNSVYSLILNKNEDRLISGGYEKEIVIWRINQDYNTINFDQVLQESQGYIYSLAINVLDTYLLSSGIDFTLNLWQKNMQTQQPEQYNFQQRYDLKFNTNVYRITFLEGNQFAIQYQHKDIISIFNIENQQIVEKQKFEIKLNVKDFDGDYLFPSIYHQKKKILVQKFNKFVFILKRFNNGMFKIIQIIDCKDAFNYGQLSNDGNILIIWDQNSKKFKIYSVLMNENNGLFESYRYESLQLTETVNRENRINTEIRQ